MNTGRRRRMVNRKEIRRKSRRYSCLVLPPLVIALILSFMSEYFLTPVNLGNLLLQMTSTAIAAMGITFIMIAGEYCPLLSLSVHRSAQCLEFRLLWRWVRESAS